MELVAQRHSFGPLLIAILFASFLFGLLSLQVYLFYHRTSAGAGLVYIHLAVASIWILNALHLGLLAHAEYFYMVTNFLNPAADDTEIWSLSLHTGIAALISFIVQCFCVGQIWSYNVRNRLLLGVIFVLMLVRLGSGIGATVRRFDAPTFGQSHHKDIWLTIFFAIMLPTDVWITACMVYTIITRRKCELVYHSFWYKVFLYVMTTGFIPCILTVISFFFFFLQNTGFIALSVHLLISELYSLTLLAILHTCPVISSRAESSSRVKQTTTEDTIATMKSFSKSMIRDELESQQKQSVHVAMDTFPTSEYRGKRGVQVFTPVYEIPMTAEGDYMTKNSTHSDQHASSRLSSQRGGSELSHAAEPHHPASRNSFQTDSTVRSRTTGPSMAWESVSSQSLERVGHDVGNVEWDGNVLHWEPRHSS